MQEMQRAWNYYSREYVQKAILEVAKNREVVSVFKDSAFGRRPDVIQYPSDIIQAVAEGTVSFHGSLERWNNPMSLDGGLNKPDLDKLRCGWDILIDPDTPDIEISKITVEQIIEAFKDHGITNYSIKFSGGKGFHIGIPFESLPEKINQQMSHTLYPDLLQKIISFLKYYTRDQLRDELVALDSAENIAKRVGKKVEEITVSNSLDPFKVVSMDIFGSRHLFRLPYSLHEKTFLASIPLKPEHVKKFEKEQALPEKVKVEEKFLFQKIKLHDAEALVIEAMDWASKHNDEPKLEIDRKFDRKFTRFVPEDYFPPCIKTLLKGVSDGKKRSVFILINFLRNMGWDIEKIEKRLYDWNQKNIPPLRSNYLRGQLRWHFRQDRILLPPNCNNANFYDSMNASEGCKLLHEQGIKNPVNYPLRLLKRDAKKSAKRK